MAAEQSLPPTLLVACHQLSVYEIDQYQPRERVEAAAVAILGRVIFLRATASAASAASAGDWSTAEYSDAMENSGIFSRRRRREERRLEEFQLLCLQAPFDF